MPHGSGCASSVVAAARPTWTCSGRRFSARLMRSQGGEPVEVGLVLGVPGAPRLFGWTQAVALALEQAEASGLCANVAVEVVEIMLEDGSMLAAVQPGDQRHLVELMPDAGTVLARAGQAAPGVSTFVGQPLEVEGRVVGPSSEGLLQPSRLGPQDREGHELVRLLGRRPCAAHRFGRSRIAGAGLPSG